VARQGIGLNKFTDQNGVKYEFTPSPDEVTQPGTPFSAEWMNEMEEQLEKAAVLSGGAVEGNFPVFNALGELINSGKGPDILQYVSDSMFQTIGGKKAPIASIEAGSYIGTGTPPTLTFSFEPKIVFILASGVNTSVSENNSRAYHAGLCILLPEWSYKNTIFSPYPSASGTGGIYNESVGTMRSVTFENNTVTWAQHEIETKPSDSSGATYDASKSYYAVAGFCYSGANYYYVGIA
jgi:hypothetical protein